MNSDVARQAPCTPSTLSGEATVLFDGLPDAALMTGGDGSIVRANPAFERLGGHEPNSLTGVPVEAVLPFAARSLAAFTGGPGRTILRRADGSELPVEVAARSWRSGAGEAILTVRDATELQAGLDIMRTVLAGGEPADVRRILAEHAARLVAADLTVVVVPAGVDRLRIEAAVGRVDLVTTPVFPKAECLSGGVIESGLGVVVGELFVTDQGASGRGAWGSGVGPAILVPLRVDDRVGGALVLARLAGGGPFGECQLDRIRALAETAALAVETIRANDERRSDAVSGEQERIAHDLYDRVIHRLFGANLGLNAAASLGGPPAQQDRLNRAVADIDQSIGDIRAIVFALRSKPPAGAEGMRPE